MEVTKGSKIKVTYTGTFEDGEVFDSTEKHGGDPLAFVAGQGMVVPGFDKAVLGMKKDESKKITITPEEGYGMPDERAVQTVPKKVMPAEVKEGMQIGVPLQNGQVMPAKITKIDGEDVTIDMNHPLAGKTLLFDITVVDIEPAEVETPAA